MPWSLSIARSLQRCSVPVWLAVAAVAGIGMLCAQAQEVIHNYDQVVDVARDGTLTVTETIGVRAEGASIKRGIYRDFPLTFTDAEGRLREVTFSLIDVTRDGKPEPHFTEREGDAIRIYAGEENVIIPRGDHTYVITYETGRQIRWFDEAPELYWNVTGNFWSFPIEEASVRVQLPGGARPERWTAYTGRLGAQGEDWRGDIDSDGALVVRTTRPLGPGEGLTIVVAIPPGAVEPPSDADRLWYAFLDYRGWIFGTLGFALVLFYYAWAWNGVGRDPKGGVIIPLFHPPEGVSPALANYIRKWGFGRDRWRAFTAAALSLAVKGYLLFDDAGEKLTLKTTGEAPPGSSAALPPGERAILNWVKGRGGTAVIDRKNGAAVARIGTDFTKSIEDENRSKFFRRNLGYFVGGLVLTGIVGAVILGFGGLRDPDLAVLGAMTVFGVAIGAFVIPMIRVVLGITGIGSAVRVALPLIVFLSAAGFIFSQFLRTVRDEMGGLAPLLQSIFGTIVAVLAAHPLPLALVLGFGAVNGLFLYLLRAPTDLGRKVMDDLEGLRLYLDTAELARLNLQVPEITAEKFEELLPYAVALDVEKPWSEAFAAALSRAYPENPMRRGTTIRAGVPAAAGPAPVSAPPSRRPSPA